MCVVQPSVAQGQINKAQTAGRPTGAMLALNHLLLLLVIKKKKDLCEEKRSVISCTVILDSSGNERLLSGQIRFDPTHIDRYV